ncbi:MAG: ATP synthase F1 subunit epsilon [Planctomycetota bacterium]|jgi:F-type H+-transporting ATPase subunit epsilon
MSDGAVHCVVVTPEKTELDVRCDSLILPMYDGELGVLPGRAPMVGRLGFGLLKLKSSGKEDVWFVDGGFVQVTRESVHVLTDRVLRQDQIDRAAAEADLQKALEIKPLSAEASALRDRSLAAARAKIRLSSR